MKQKLLIIRKKLAVLAVFIFLLFGYNSASAQLPTLVSDTEARVMLTERIPELRDQFNNMNVGDAGYDFAERRLSMYVHSWEMLESGFELEEAVVASYAEFGEMAVSNATSESSYSETDKAFDSGDNAYNDLINFLKL